MKPHHMFGATTLAEILVGADRVYQKKGRFVTDRGICKKAFPRGRDQKKNRVGKSVIAVRPIRKRKGGEEHLGGGLMGEVARGGLS